MERVASTESTDKSLIEAHIQGDKTAFEELVCRYGDSLLGYLTRMTGSREQAEDLFQEIFKRVHEKAHTLNSSNFKGWLFTIGTRAAIDGLRRRKRLRFVSLNQAVDGDGADGEDLATVVVAEQGCEPSEDAIRAEQKQQVRQALDSLPAKQRAAVVLAYYQGLSYREVAEVLGCSIGTVKTQMYRALRKLARTLPDVSGVAK